MKTDLLGEKVMNKNSLNITPFNSALETGLRSLCVLVSGNSNSFDLQQLIAFDYLVVHTGDIKGAPSSLHPKNPNRNGELLVRRTIVERGLLLMESRGLVQKLITSAGFKYKSSEFAPIFLDSLTSPYIKKLLERAKWVTLEYQSNDNQVLPKVFKNAFDRWATEFQFTKLRLSSNQ